MARDAAPLPDGVELVGADGDGPTGSAAEGAATPAPPGGRAPWWSWVALAVAAAAVLALVADRLADEDGDATHDPEPSQLGIFELDEVDIADAVRRDDVTYPLFDRTWDHALVLLQRNTVIAVDLETGASIELADISGVAGTTPAFVDGRFVEDTLFLQTWDGDLLEVGPDRVRWRFEVGPDDAPHVNGALVGDWYARSEADDAGEITAWVASLRTGHTIDLDPLAAISGAGPSVLVTRGESIVAVAPDGTETVWAVGQPLLAGHDRSVWRTCPTPTDCLVWAGDETDPRAAALRNDLVLDPGSHPRVPVGFGSPPLPFLLGADVDAWRLAPDGRLLWAADRSGTIGLVDLAGDGRVRMQGVDSRPAILPDGRSAITTSGSIPTVIDLETGAMARIRLPDGNGALRQNVIAFVPAEQLPFDR